MNFDYQYTRIKLCCFIIWALAFCQVIMRKNLVWHAAFSQISDFSMPNNAILWMNMVYGT